MQLECEALLNDYFEANRELLSQFDPDSCIQILDTVPCSGSYHSLPEDILRIWDQVNSVAGEAGFETLQKSIMLRLIGQFEERSEGHQFSDSIRACFSKSFGRIVASIKDPDFTKYRNNNDILLKDLAICRQKMFPAGAQVVEPNSSFHRSIMHSGGVGQAIRVANFLLKCGGSDHWYQIHTHLSELDDFNPDGWDRCYFRLAEMLSLNPDIRGMCGGSWFYDPALETISPRLAYLRKIPQENGAAVFYSNIDVHGGALATSRTRKKAFDAGEYVPKSYLVLWPRSLLLRWAESKRASENSK